MAGTVIALAPSGTVQVSGHQAARPPSPAGVASNHPETSGSVGTAPPTFASRHTAASSPTVVHSTTPRTGSMVGMDHGAPPHTTNAIQPPVATRPPRTSLPGNVGVASPPATAPTRTTIVRGGSTHAGSYCNGWITRVAAPQLTIYDNTGGRAVTASDCANAHAFYNAVAAANAKYGNINVAKANNFRPGSDPAGQYIQHYVNWNNTAGVADPTNPEGLAYHFDAAGHATLMGVYFFESAGTTLRQPAGPLTAWHSHTPTSSRMLHVWLFAGCRDPFAFMISGAM